jgi:hypothetical protein
MKTFVLSILLTVLGFSVNVANSSFANASTSIGNGDVYGCVIPRLGGDKVPFPKLQSANTKFDLADNETYVLNGYVVVAQGRYYFRIDFNSQPWLATAARLANPYIEIDPSSAVGRYANGQLVQMAVVAKRASMIGAYQNQSVQSLQMILPPVPLN